MNLIRHWAIPLFFGILSLTSCVTSNMTMSERIDITCDNALPCLEDTNLYQQPRLFSFLTDSTDGIVKRISRLLIIDDKTYVLDRAVNKVMMYDKNGRFLRSTARFIGKAANEYIRIIDVTTDNQHIYVSCDAPYQIMEFDKELNLLSCTKVDEFLEEIATDGIILYGIRNSGKNAQAQEVIGYKLSHLDSEPIIIIPPHNGVSGREVMGKGLTQSRGKVYVNLPFDINLYVIRDGQILEKYELDFGETGLLQHPIPKNIVADDFDKTHANIVWGIVNLNVSDSTLLFNTNKGHTHIINRNDMTQGGCITMLNDDFGIFSSEIIPCIGQNNEVRFLLHEMTIVSLLRNYDNNIKKIPILREVKERYERDGGPILVVWQIK